MSGTLLGAAAAVALLSSKQDFHCSVWHQSPLCVPAAESSLNALALLRNSLLWDSNTACY